MPVGSGRTNQKLSVGGLADSGVATRNHGPWRLRLGHCKRRFRVQRCWPWPCAALSDVCEVRAASPTTALPVPHVERERAEVGQYGWLEVELEADELQPRRP